MSNQEIKVRLIYINNLVHFINSSVDSYMSVVSESPEIKTPSPHDRNHTICVKKRKLSSIVKPVKDIRPPKRHAKLMMNSTTDVDDDLFSPIMPGVEQSPSPTTDICRAANVSVLKIMMAVFFGSFSPVTESIYQRWCRNITGRSSLEQKKNLKRLLIKLTSSKGCLELSDKYIRIFEESETGDRDHESELLIYLSDEQKPIVAKLSKILTKFCSNDCVCIIKGTRCYKNYKYNDELSMLLEDISLGIVKSFCDYYINQSQRRGCDGIENKYNPQRRVIRDVLGSMMHDTTFPMSPIMHRLCISFLHLVPVSDTYHHNNLHTVVSSMERKIEEELVKRNK